jgi:hypothetical protein
MGLDPDTAQPEAGATYLLAGASQTARMNWT